MLGANSSAAQARTAPWSDGDAAGLPPCGNLVADVNAIAERWFGRRQAECLKFDTAVPTPEALADVAGRSGLEVSYEQRALSKLRPSDFPCVMLDREGGSRLLAGLEGEGRASVLVRGAFVTVPLRQLEARHTGTVFFVRPRLDAQVAEERVRAAGEAVPFGSEPTARGLFAAVLRHMAIGHARLFALLGLSALIGNVLMLAIPVYSMAVYDRVVPHLAFETLWALTTGVLIVLGADFAIRLVRHQLVDAMAVKTSVALQARLFARMLRMPLDKAPRNAALIQLWMRELDALCQTVPLVVVSAIVDLPFILVITALLYALGGPVALVPVAVAFLLGAIYAATHAMSIGRARELNMLARAQATLVAEAADGLEAVKLAAAEGVVLRRFERLADSVAYAGHEARHWTVLGNQATLALGQVAIVLAMLMGVYVIADNAMTIGALSAATLLVGRLMAPVGQFVAGLQRLRILVRSADGLDKVLAAPIEEGGDRRAGGDIEGRFDLRSVRFSYPDAHAPALDDVSLVIRPGEKVAIIGRVGCGKSTLLRLLVRLCEPASGSVLVDESDIRQVSPELLRRQVSLMRQDQALFDDTLRANLCFGLDEVPQDVFDRAVAVAGVREIAARHPAGYGQRIGPRGERLSGGERQMVALARALMTDPRVLVLDEPTASMDNTLEGRVVRDLQAFAEGRTVVVATHRAQTLALADRIVWIEGGRIVADGPKDEVLRKLNGS
jgi:ATP-binding cassette subfamily C protein LapB